MKNRILGCLMAAPLLVLAMAQPCRADTTPAATTCKDGTTTTSTGKGTCSGHGGIWGARTENFEIAVKVGKPAAQAALKNDTSFVASECPLAADHLMQVMEMTAGDQKPKPTRALHPIELLARAYGLTERDP